MGQRSKIGKLPLRYGLLLRIILLRFSDTTTTLQTLQTLAKQYYLIHQSSYLYTIFTLLMDRGEQVEVITSNKTQVHQFKRKIVSHMSSGTLSDYLNWTSAVNVNVRKVSFMSKVCENNLTCVIYIIQRIQEVTAEYNFGNNDGRCKQMSIICASKVFG